jgi:hypothetical protein
VRFSRVPLSLSLAALSLALGLSVSGCVDTVGQARVDPAAAPTRIARREGVSPRGATVALATIDGAPQQASDAFSNYFGQATGAYDLSVVEPKGAAYLVRGYLSAYPSDQGGTRFSYLFDVFDQRKVRVARLSYDLPVAGAAADPWALADAKVMQALAERSVSDLADALTNTPEAVAGAAVASSARSSETKVSQSGTTIAPRVAASTGDSGPRLGFAAAR